LAAQDAEALVELPEILVGARALVRRPEEEVAQAGGGEAQRREPKLVGERVPLGERERPERLVARDERLEPLEIVALAVDAQRVHRGGQVEDELAAARGLEIDDGQQLVALEEKMVVEQVAVDDALRQLVLEVVLEVRDLVVEGPDDLPEVRGQTIADVGVELRDAIVVEPVLDALLVALADQVQIGERAADVLQARDREAIGTHDLPVQPPVQRHALAVTLAVQATLPVREGLRALEAVLAEVDQQVEL